MKFQLLLSCILLFSQNIQNSPLSELRILVKEQAIAWNTIPNNIKLHICRYLEDQEPTKRKYPQDLYNTGHKEALKEIAFYRECLNPIHYEKTKKFWSKLTNIFYTTEIDVYEPRLNPTNTSYLTRLPQLQKETLTTLNTILSNPKPREAASHSKDLSPEAEHICALVKRNNLREARIKIWAFAEVIKEIIRRNKSLGLFNPEENLEGFQFFRENPSANFIVIQWFGRRPNISQQVIARYRKALSEGIITKISLHEVQRALSAGNKEKAKGLAINLIRSLAKAQ